MFTYNKLFCWCQPSGEVVVSAACFVLSFFSALCSCVAGNRAPLATELLWEEGGGSCWWHQSQDLSWGCLSSWWLQHQLCMGRGGGKAQREGRGREKGSFTADPCGVFFSSGMCLSGPLGLFLFCWQIAGRGFFSRRVEEHTRRSAIHGSAKGEVFGKSGQAWAGDKTCSFTNQSAIALQPKERCLMSS